jgi:hypothetical protein
MDWIKIIIPAIAIYGAVLSTYTLICNRRDKKRRIKVAFSRGYLTSVMGLSEQMLFITVTNPGDRTVRIMVPGILLPDKRSIVFPSPKGEVTFPHDLLEGRSCKIWESLEYARSELQKMGFRESIDLVPFVDNSVGDRYFGKKWRFLVTKSKDI